VAASFVDLSVSPDSKPNIIYPDVNPAWLD